MGSSDNFCLRWNDFESNISTSFRELREDSEFFDVSLCCDNGTDVVPAHKVILAACSPLFRKILSRQKNQQNPFLYLKGIHLKELQAVLNFMYHGEVNVAQDSLNNFLAVAEELAVKGLTTDSKPGSEPISTPSGSSKKAVPPKRKPPQTPSGSTHPSPSTSAKKPKISQADDVVDIDPHDVDIKSIKAEPEPSGSGGGVGASGAVAHGGPDPDLGDDSYAGDQDDNGDFGAGEDFEGFEQYGDGAEFDDSMAGAAAAGGSGAAADGKDPSLEGRGCCLTQSKFGNPILWDGFRNSYYRIKTCDQRLKTVWKCRQPGCKARVHTNDVSNVIIKVTNQHVHEAVVSGSTHKIDPEVIIHENDVEQLQSCSTFSTKSIPSLVEQRVRKEKVDSKSNLISAKD